MAAEPQPHAIETGWFAAPVCRNCGATRDTPYCSACGQKAARRLAWSDTVKETWDRLRVFEFGFARTAWRLVTSPGGTAREYVLGKRSSHTHPLKLLAALVAALVLVLVANRYFAHYGFTGQDRDVDRMAERVMAYANWSFSLGIFAIFAASMIVFPRRLGYNTIEHAVLAIYCQSVVLGVILVNLLPTLIWRDAGFILWHKTASQYYIPAVKVAIVAVGFTQFFRLRFRVDWLRIVTACLIFAGMNWVLLRIYAMAILWLVSRHT